jgi:hypothetical protein
MTEAAQGHSRSNKFTGYLILGLALLFIFGGLGWYNYRAFGGNGSKLTPESADCLALSALVTDRTKSTGFKNSGATINYRYEVAGKVYEQREDVDESTYYVNLTRDSVAICANRDKPARSNIIGNDVGTVSQIQTIIVDVIMLIVVIIVAMKARKISRQSKE